MNSEASQSQTSKRGDQDAKEWAHERAAQFGEAVQFWRKKLGLTAVDLSNRTKEVGYPITRATIAKIETNARNAKVDMAEVTSLAAALRVSPIDLIFPGFPDTLVRVTPRSRLNSDASAMWFSADPRYTESFSYTLLGGPHAPTSDNSVDLRRAAEDFHAYCKSVSSLPEIKNHPAPFGNTRAIQVPGANRYRSEAKRMANKVETLGGRVRMPFWYDNVREPDGEG